MTTAAVYAEFAARETRGVSPAYERLSLAVSRDDEVLALLGRLPPAKRQPNLLFGVVRFLGGPDACGAAGGVHRGGTHAAGALDRDRGPGRAGLPDAPRTARQSFLERTRARRDPARLDLVARAGDQLVRVALRFG